MSGFNESTEAGRSHALSRCRPALGAGVGGLLLALLTAVALRPIVSMPLLLAWSLVTLFAYLVWLTLTLVVRSTSAGPTLERRWRQWFVAAAGVVGIVWGIGGGFMLFPEGAPGYQLLLVVVFIATSLIAVVPLAPTRWGGAAFVVPALTPLAGRIFWETGPAHLIAGGVLLVVIRALLKLHRHLHDDVERLREAEQDGEALQEQLQTNRQRLDEVQRIAAFGDWHWALESDRIQWSDEVFHLYDFEPGQLVTRSVILFAIHPADRDLYEQALDALIEDGAALDVEFRIVRPDGQIRYLRDVAEAECDEAGRPRRLKGVTSDITERVEAESRTRNAWRELNRVLESMEDTYFRIDATGKVAVISRSVHNLLGYRSDELAQASFVKLCARASEWPAFLRALTSGRGRVHNYPLELRRKDGGPVQVAVNAQYVPGIDGEPQVIDGVARDTSDLQMALAALDQEKERALVTLESIGDGVITTDEQGGVKYLNPVAEKLLGCDTANAGGQHYLELLAVVDEATGESLGDLVKFCLTGNTSVVHADEGRFIHRDGTEYHLKITAAPIRDRDGGVLGAVLVLHDITDVMGMAQQLSYQASHDTLTGLFNRQVFERSVEERIHGAQAGDGGCVVLYMDLDQFKVVNDTCGHPAGDELLQQVAMLMQRSVRESDVLARLGGDEFGVLLEQCPLPKAIDIAEEIRARIRDFRFVWKDKLFDIGVSIGVVPVDGASASYAEVLAAADAACYVAKDQGRNRIHVYQLEDDAVARRHGEMQWVHRLSAAFDEDRFILYAQPVVHLADDRLVSHYEVLVRMTDPQGDVVPPMAFIPAAERYNLMPALDRWVVRTALCMMRDAQGNLAFPPLNCAINISGQSLGDDHFLEFVVELFDETNIPPEAISFEITETAAIANLTRATRFIQVLRDMGCSFALDDFGSGLSSFAYLKNMAVDYLKIDGCFVKHVAADRVDRAMVESINEIGHVLGLKTIAEYVDRDDTVAVLSELGVDFVQGNGIGKPRPFSAILEESLAHIVPATETANHR